MTCRVPTAPSRSRPGALVAGFATALFLQGCAPAPILAPPVLTFEEKMSWVLRLEDRRVLQDPAPLPAPVPAGRRRGPAVEPAPVPDLLRLLSDREGRLRRRAALAIGRVGLAEGRAPLVAALSGDAEPEVRQMAAFALGLLGDPEARAPLRAALADASPVVRGRAAEALSRLGDAESAGAIGRLVAAQVRSGAVADLAPDDLAESLAPDAEAFRLGVLALGRLKAYDALAASVLDRSGQPAVRWWPVAAALQQTEDRRALGPLLALARGEGRLARAFAAKGLGALGDAAAVDTLAALALDWRADRRTAASAIRALAQIGDARAAPAISTLVETSDLDPALSVEAVAAAGSVRAVAATGRLLDLLGHPWPPLRAAALRAIREIDPEGFTVVLSGLEPDRHWSVRAELASVLSTVDAGAALPRLRGMLADPDVRVVPSVLGALRAVGAPGVEQTLAEWLKHDDPVVRAAAASGIGELRAPGGATALIEAWRAAGRDEGYVARGAILAALSRYGRAAAEPTLREALADPDYAVRVRAASLLGQIAPGGDVQASIRPAPTRHPDRFYSLPRLVAPAVSPHALVETSRGTIEIELAVLEAPLTCEHFAALAEAGFFDGSLVHRVVPNFVVQDGDPRGDGEGGPGYSVRDEPGQRPYLRGTVGMALDWSETGGSQFFITHSPQPHLDGRYTVIGRVVAGMDVVDALQRWDAIVRVRVWDGETMRGRERATTPDAER